MYYKSCIFHKVKNHTKLIVHSFVNPSASPFIGLSLVKSKRKVDAYHHVSFVSISANVLYRI